MGSRVTSFGLVYPNRSYNAPPLEHDRRRELEFAFELRSNSNESPALET